MKYRCPHSTSKFKSDLVIHKLGTYKVRNETKRNQRKRNETKRNQRNGNEMKRNQRKKKEID